MLVIIPYLLCDVLRAGLFVLDVDDGDANKVREGDERAQDEGRVPRQRQTRVEAHDQ